MTHIKINENNIVSLLQKIITTIPNLKETINGIVGVQLRHLPNNDSFQVLNDVGNSMTETIVSVTPDNTVGIRKTNHVLHTIYAPRIYPVKEKIDTVVPPELLLTYSNMFHVDVLIVRYVFSLLHELGHIVFTIDRPGHPARILQSITDLMDAFDDYESEKYETKESEMHTRYRENYGELYADNFAYKWLPFVFTRNFPENYFENATSRDIQAANKKYYDA